MTITDDVHSQLFTATDSEQEIIRIPPTRPAVNTTDGSSTMHFGLARSPRSQGRWTRQEHDLFLEGLTMFPTGPWKSVASHIGTKTARQTMTHAQKYRQKIARRARGLKKTVRDRPAEEDEDEYELPAGALPLMSEADFTAYLAEIDLSDEEGSANSPLFSAAVGSEMMESLSLEASAQSSPEGSPTSEFSPAVLNALRDAVFIRQPAAFDGE